MATAFVYFIRGGDLIKIGTSANPAGRLREMQTGNAMELSLIGTFQGGRRQERELHMRFAHLRVRGEWFRAEEDLQKEIDRLISSAPMVVEQELEESDEDSIYHEESFSMFNTAWAHFLKVRITFYPNESPMGPRVQSWFEEAYSIGCGGNFALEFLLRAGNSLHGKSDDEQRRLLIAVALIDAEFCFNVSDLAEKWARETGAPWPPVG
jgi:hypothetical protein